MSGPGVRPVWAHGRQAAGAPLRPSAASDSPSTPLPRPCPRGDGVPHPRLRQQLFPVGPALSATFQPFVSKRSWSHKTGSQGQNTALPKVCSTELEFGGI